MSPTVVPRLHVVTGKGGTGKTTVAAALALHLARDGGRVLLIEVEGRQGISQLFDVPPLPYEERRVAVAEGGGDVYALAIDPEDALYEYLDMYYRLGRAGRALRKVGVVDFATTVAPGVRDVLLTGKAYEATRRREENRYVYDAVVIDAPPTGRIGRFLNVNTEVAGLAKMGPIKRQAESIMDLLRSEQSVVHLVTLLEDMPVQETLDACSELHELALPLGAIIVNQARPPILSAAELKAARDQALDLNAVEKGLEAAQLGSHAGLVASLAREATDHAERIQLQRDQRHRLTVLERPLVDVPWVADGVDLGALYALARSLGCSEAGAPW